MRLPFELFLALRYLRFHRGRTFLSVITTISMGGVMVGTSALVIALALMAGFVQDVRDRIHSGSAHLTVLSARDETFEDAAALAARLAAVEGVEAASPVLYTPAMLVPEAGGDAGFAELQGVDPAGHARVVHGATWGGSPFLALEHGASDGAEGVVLGSELALRLGVATGDRVRAVVPRVTLAPWAPVPRSRVFEVRGTFSSGHFQHDSQRAYVAAAAAERLLEAPGRAAWLELRLARLDTLEPMRERLREVLGPAWLVVDLIEQNRDILRALNTERLLLFLAIGLIVVVAAMNIVSTLVLTVSDKVREIGTLGAMGTRPATIAIVFVLQGLVIGVVGAAAGVTLGTGTVWWLDHYRVLHLDPDVYYLDHVPFAVRGTDLLFVAGAAIAVSLLATIYPAVKAARLEPVEAIRHE